MACKQPIQDLPSRRGYDEHGCLSLLSVLETFNAAINQEQAWAVCFQLVKAAKSCLEENRGACFYATKLDHVKLHKDGSVHRTTFFGNSSDADFAWREPVTSDCKLVADLALIIYKAVDFGLEQDVERKLDTALGDLICRMAPVDPSANDSREDDEGIEQDAGEADEGDKQGILDEILQECINNLNLIDEEKADLHYKPVCRALVTECVDLITFLEKVGHGARELKTTHLDDDRDFNVHDLHSTDWERLWVQVIKQLREGVKLKKVEDVSSEKKPIEYELTPYEMLMNDIRSKKYKLNKVSLEGGLPPRVKEDAHEIILDFIRSRPPLKKVNDREHLPPKVEKTPHDELMEAIRNTAPTSLKPTRHSTSALPSLTAGLDETDANQGNARRRITVDHRLTAFDDSDDSDTSVNPSEPSLPPRQPQSLSASKKRLTVDEKTMLAAKSSKSKRPTKLYEPSPRAGETKAKEDPNQRRRNSIGSPGRRRGGVPQEPLDAPTPSSKSVFQEALMQSNMWRQQIDCLSLTLEEVVHIRSVLTRAELETLLFDMKLYKDVAKGKVCFSCRKTRFGLLGAKDYTCKLCEQAVCRKCCATMEIPVDHLQTVPVFFLSPPQSNETSPVDNEGATGPKSLFARFEGLYKDKPKALSRNTVGSAPNSPQFSRSNSLAAADPSWRSKSPQVLKSGEKGSSLLRRETMTVCTDCQVMVKQIILSSHEALRSKGRRLSAERRAVAGKSSAREGRSVTPTQL